MRHPLDGVNAKIGWAKKHLQELERELVIRWQSGDYGLRSYVDPNTREEFVYLWVPYGLRVEWGLRAGDIVHSLRSALDHLIIRLVEANGQTPSRNNSFPIYLPQTQDRDKKVKASLKGVRQGVITKVKTLQPQTADDLLWVLNRLDNDDKHNLIHVASVGTDVRLGMGGTIKSFRLITSHPMVDGIEDGADHYRRTADPGMYVRIEPKVEVTFSVTGPGAGKEVRPLLAQLIDHVEVGIVPLFGLTKVKPRDPVWKPPGSRQGEPT